ncbi:hypothetical protein N7454_005908 [Penicillium verhagenii]|nr:hypothetical protein N7454_005908 [Penicillium verhagenii]
MSQRTRKGTKRGSKNDDPQEGSSKRKKVSVKELNERIAEGYVTDVTERELLKIEDLDLDVEYGVKEPLQRYRVPPVRKRWRHKGPEPLNDPLDLPNDWSMYDDDVDPQDLEAQIVRTKERISDNIMPYLFEANLFQLEKEAEWRREMAEGLPEGLSWDVIQRIHTLNLIGHEKVRLNDPNEHVETIRQIQHAYRHKALDWTPGLVTYWRKGKQLCKPRPFKWDEYEAVCRTRNDVHSFWVEGFRLALRLPGVQNWVELDFLWDTGASVMTIYRSDINAMLGPFAGGGTTAEGLPRYSGVMGCGSELILGIGGAQVIRDVIEVEFTILHPQTRLRMMPWTRTKTTVSPGCFVNNTATARLDGPVMRSMLYFGTAPDNNLYREVVLSTVKSMNLPTFNLGQDPRVGIDQAVSGQAGAVYIVAPGAGRPVAPILPPGLPVFPVAMPSMSRLPNPVGPPGPMPPPAAVPPPLPAGTKYGVGTNPARRGAL